MSDEFQSGIAARTRGQFATTQWSVVLTASESDSPGSAAALETLCRTYWPSLYAFARRQGHAPEDAKDLTQGFFALLIAKRLSRRADPELGRFRTFLLRAFSNYLHDCRRRERAAKRGGHYALMSLDVWAVEEQLATDFHNSAELLFDRKWASTVVGEATALLQAEYNQRGQSQLFDALCPSLQGDGGFPAPADVARTLGLTEGAVKVAVYRLRRRYRELLRAVVAHTVEDPREIDDEIRHLAQVLAG